ncbi:hypothetical protein [Burkholderia sp. Bp9031]|uniref:hypothetical protein n=1 Tax=Burkholderia sp. Bp9031 TaxID=2184566 RepID=UPI001F5BA20C|nr:MULTISPECIES: hypothetical protein [Burkholderia]
MERSACYPAFGACQLAIAIDTMGFCHVCPMTFALFSDPRAGILPADASEHARNFYLGFGYGSIRSACSSRRC